MKKISSKSVLLLGMLFLSLEHHGTSGQRDYGSCVNPRGQQGRCLNIRSCEPLLSLLRAYGNGARDFLRQSLCLYDNNDPIVCCPVTPGDDNNDNNNNNNNTNITEKNNDNPSNRQGQYGPLSSPVCGYTDAKYTRIVSGVPADLGSWPWASLLGYRSKKNPSKPRWLCGGVLISARHVLTAGHCVYNRDDLFLVRLGELDLEDDNEGATPIDVPIEKKSVHPAYSPNMYTSDVAVLRLDRDIEFSALIKPICLPTTEDIQRIDLTKNRLPFVVGWGSVYYNGPTASQLQQVQVPVVTEARCKAAYAGRAVIDDRVLCAGYAEGGKDACQGDSGGPMMFPIGKTWYSVGVVSYGFRCALPGYPGVYSKTQSFLDFIIPLLN